MNKPLNPAARKTGLVVQEALDELLVYDMETNKAHCLNKTAAYVWQACNGSRNISEIAEYVGSLAGTKFSDDLVWLAIDQLNDNDLLEKAFDGEFNGISRRDVIKKIGLTSMVALPIIASLVAPPTAMASASCNCVSDLACQAAPNLGCPTTTCNSTGFCRP